MSRRRAKRVISFRVTAEQRALLEGLAASTRSGTMAEAFDAMLAAADPSRRARWEATERARLRDEVRQEIAAESAAWVQQFVRELEEQKRRLDAEARRRAEEERRRAEEEKRRRRAEEERQARSRERGSWRNAASPPQGALDELGLTWPCTVEEVGKAQRRAAFERHPDRGGDEAAMKRANLAAEAILRWLRRAA